MIRLFLIRKLLLKLNVCGINCIHLTKLMIINCEITIWFQDFIICHFKCVRIFHVKGFNKIKEEHVYLFVQIAHIYLLHVVH